MLVFVIFWDCIPKLERLDVWGKCMKVAVNWRFICPGSTFTASGGWLQLSRGYCIDCHCSKLYLCQNCRFLRFKYCIWEYLSMSTCSVVWRRLKYNLKASTIAVALIRYCWWKCLYALKICLDHRSFVSVICDYVLEIWLWWSNPSSRNSS